MKNNLQREVADDEIDLRALLTIIMQGKWTIICITLIFSVASIIYAVSQPDIYRADITLVPANEDTGAGNLPGQLGGLASLAGLNLGNGSDSKTRLALAVLNSKKFKMDFIERHDLLPELMAVEEWNASTNRLVFNEDIYNPTTGTWIRKVDPPKQAKPSLQEASLVFDRILTSVEDKASGLVSISIEHRSPYIAQQWLEWLTHDLNENMRAREKEESAKSIEYLETQLEKTHLADIKQVLFELIEEQTKTYMFTEVRDEYIFKTIDPAIVPEQKAKPSRALICIIGTFIGGFFSIGIVLVRDIYSK
ncbi:Wzz/FepE/Etk N-terminal domain-containing protein [Pseudidiomarina gelatinasegens]|uniref:Wzz/FepE/Etk N-terminal domain-containing protein n=1 Tax=Pseudidiomarina gelatinasegens TaxID=2487740 RepID=UPI003A96E117